MKFLQTIKANVPATLGEWGCLISLLFVAGLAIGVFVFVWRIALGL